MPFRLFSKRKRFLGVNFSFFTLSQSLNPLFPSFQPIVRGNQKPFRAMYLIFARHRAKCRAGRNVIRERQTSQPRLFRKFFNFDSDKNKPDARQKTPMRKCTRQTCVETSIYRVSRPYGHRDAINRRLYMVIHIQ